MRRTSKNSRSLSRLSASGIIRGFFRFVVRVVGCVFSVLLSLMLIFFLGQTLISDLVRNAFGFRQARDISVTVVREELLAVSELATYEYAYVNHVDYTNQPQLFGHDVLLTDNWFAFDYHGIIKAGYDLEQIDVLWIDPADQTVGISLPAVTVFSNEIYADMATYQDRNNLCNPLRPRDVLDFLYAQQEPELEKALAQNLLGLAEENAMRLISLIIEGQGYSAVFVD